MNNYIEIWKMKKLYKKLRDVRGNGTSMISLIAPPNSQVSQLNRLLTEEYGTATNIKSRVNRLSVLDAITSTQQRLKLYNKIPTNGLLLYCGTIINEDGKEKRLTIDLEPFKPINTSLYMCDNKFHVEVLNELMEDEDVYGFIIMNGDGSLYGTLQGNTKNIIYQFNVELPKKHGRGGQSSVRFARLRMEARHNYLRKVAELATQYFITDNKCNVKGLILAGSADFKTELSKSDLFDQRLHTKIIQIVDIAYGGLNGFNQAIQLASESLGNLRFIIERKLLLQYFTEIDIDSGKYCFGIKDLIFSLELGAVETCLIFENLMDEIFIIKHKISNQEIVNIDNIFDKDEYDLIESILFIDWIANNYQKYGTNIEFISDGSPEGNQFIKGFSGIGGLLRWKVEFDND
jgi:peptide chain release factor subunit 1